MGIKHLWDILECTRQEKNLKEFRGRKIAVDFSCWFVECHASPFPNRSIFYRILDLMSNGITPVIVLDSRESLELKTRKRGDNFYNSTFHWEALLKEMGFPVIRASGEAEKVCAQLNSANVVDGCITNDGDALAYGATTVFKGYTKMKNSEIQVYEMPKIKEVLELGQKEIIAAAVLIGCNYFDGVNNVGHKKFQELVTELKNRQVTDILERMSSWDTNDELLLIIEDQKKLDGMKKSTHCSQCSHSGSIPKHQKTGCLMCCTDKGCKEKKGKNKESNVVSCSCEYHTLKSRVEPFSFELTVRESALNPQDPSKRFSVELQKVISEFTSSDSSVSNHKELTVKKPNFPQVCDLLRKRPFEFDDKTICNLFPALMKMTLYGQVEDLKATEFEILKECKKDWEPCYLLKFQRFEFDTLTTENENGYEINVLRSVIDNLYPHLSLKEEEKTEPEDKQVSTSKGRKRENDMKITDIWRIKKESRMGENFTDATTAKTDEMKPRIGNKKAQSSNSKASQSRSQMKLTDMFPVKKEPSTDVDSTK